MPATRRRRNAATESAEQPSEGHDEEQDAEQRRGQDEHRDEAQDIATLKFKEPLTWKVGRPIQVAELLARLERLFKELKDYEQDYVDKDSLSSVATDLAHSNLVSHRDKGVRAYTACCLVEIFRLCAPDAPYNEKQLKDIFTLLVVIIIPALADPSDPYNTQHAHVLDSLVNVKSIVLLVDINPSASNKLILEMFTSCFDVLSGSSKASSGEEIGKNVEFQMTGLLQTLLDEAETLPDQVVDIILAQFLRADPRIIQAGGGRGKKSEPIDHKQSTLLMKQAPPAYNMAKNICNSHPDKMGRYITQYFSSVIMSASGVRSELSAKPGHKSRAKDVGESSEVDVSGPSEAELKELQKAHVLARELWRAAPDVLQNIVPQVEAELVAENEDIRLLATETMGDMVAGVGAAGPPPSPVLDPAAYPSQSLQISRDPVEYNFLTTPNSPHAFNSLHSVAYQTFLGRRNDKSSRIRAAWTTAVGQIILTSAGRVGLDDNDESSLLKHLATMLVDGDEKVRLAAIEVIGHFPFQDFVDKLGKAGGVAESGSVLCNLSERMKDPKSNVRTEAMTLLGKIWGIATGAIAEGNQRVHELFAPIPSRIFDTFYINDLSINMLVDDVLYQSLCPLQFPPTKPKQANGTSQKPRVLVNGDSLPAGLADEGFDADKIRVERILLLVRDLEARAKKVFFAFQARQTQYARTMTALLQRCEDYNGGVMDKNEAETKKKLNNLIEWYAKMLPDPTKATEELRKFAKMHDRRSYALIRFCIAHESDFRKVQKAIKELTKRIEESSGSGSSILDTVLHLVWRASIVFYNISHVPAIMEFARTNEKDLGATAHEVLKDISMQNPDVFKRHIKELCEGLVHQAPSAKRSNDSGAVSTLKACAGFARRFPQEIPGDRKFLQSMINFALYGIPTEVAKYAVSVLMSGPKKEMHAKDLAAQCTKDFTYGSEHFVPKLATLSQLLLLASNEIEDEVDSIIEIATNRVLTHHSTDDICSETEWHTHPDIHLQAKSWALKILVNRLRGLDPSNTDIARIAAPVYELLNNLVANSGELSKTTATPASHRSALRLLATQLLLKLSRHSKALDRLLRPAAFHTLATVAQDPTDRIRADFVNALMKHLAAPSTSAAPASSPQQLQLQQQHQLRSRFYVPLFLLAFEPSPSLRSAAQTWLRARAATSARAQDLTMEMVFARLLSALAWHPDFDGVEGDADELLVFVQYLLFYLECVATRENVAVIFNVAQRVKGVQDGIVQVTKGGKGGGETALEKASERLYVMSELAQGTIRQFTEEKGWSLQAWPGKLGLPNDIFVRMPGHEQAQEVAMRQYLSEEVRERLEGVVRAGVRGRKRKSEQRDAEGKRKKIRSEREKGERAKAEKRAKVIKTPKKRRAESEDAPSSARRRSARTSGRKSYVEQDDSEDERDMERWNESDEEDAERANDDPELKAKKVTGQEDSDRSDEDEAGEDSGTPMPDADPEVKRETRTRSKGKRNSRMANGAARGANGKEKAKKKETPIIISSDRGSDDDLSELSELERDA
ncbi:MAG: hypothetical protein M1822_007570 [Bathelium mastoideum]|nr:MAG: hypothetical protein M1822_007570 [Bathelium mastoideum]